MAMGRNRGLIRQFADTDLQGMHGSIDVGERVAGARRVLVDAQRQAALELVSQLALEAWG